MSDRQADARNRAENCNADEADDREPEFPGLDAEDSNEIGDLDQTNGRSDNDRSQCRQWAESSQPDSAPPSSSRATASAPTTPVSWVFAPASLAPPGYVTRCC